MERTKSKQVSEDADEHAVSCDHGLCSLERWTENCNFAGNIFHVPSLEQSFNTLKNAVDCYYQRRATNALVRRRVAYQ